MTEDKIRNLIQKVDRMAGRPGRTLVDTAAVRRRAGRRRLVRLTCSATAAAVLVIAVGIWYRPSDDPARSNERERIMALETRITELQASTDAALALIQEVLEDERSRTRLDQLEAELASIQDPHEEIRRQVDETAFNLLFQADRLYRELNETESAVETYKRVIKLFPRNQWAAVARERLAEIESRRI